MSSELQAKLVLVLLRHSRQASLLGADRVAQNYFMASIVGLAFVGLALVFELYNKKEISAIWTIK